MESLEERLRRELEESLVRAAGLQMQGHQQRLRAERAETARLEAEKQVAKLRAEVELLQKQLAAAKAPKEGHRNEMVASGGKRKAGATGGAVALGSPRKALPPVPSFTAPPKPAAPRVPRATDPAVLLRQLVRLPSRKEMYGPMPGEVGFLPHWNSYRCLDINRQADVDPDSIFGSRVPPCDLEELFPEALFREVGAPLPKKLKRSESGDLELSPVCAAEVLDYKRKMGQTRGWKEMIAS
eukprot:TRINITY_DN110223_c0_g1_i1.p1 TRINITY_DN110223_c0_g1~~TRINITY_DN110223_c0_g1_i1.p1  ORF type:complete len:240 (-),score=64.77 TRINITY_DN110223_c0_g1_i1:30-749(-)